ncbi:hypothetical protein [Streptomyces sp. NPDC048489]|uniref:hypothetical protein n=1 Tax=Streptomyces sp. NPDC048489 TaxID=3154504 RepID=UPI0034301D7D
MADRTAWRICRDNCWWSLFGNKRSKGKKAGPPVHDDLVRLDFSARGPNRLWLADITEHGTGAAAPSRVRRRASNIPRR